MKILLNKYFKITTIILTKIYENIPSTSRMVWFKPIFTSNGTAISSNIPVAILAETNLLSSVKTIFLFQLLLLKTQSLFVTNAKAVAHNHDNILAQIIAADTEFLITALNEMENNPKLHQLTTVVRIPQNK